MSPISILTRNCIGGKKKKKKTNPIKKWVTTEPNFSVAKLGKSAQFTLQKKKKKEKEKAELGPDMVTPGSWTCISDCG